jgi:di/tricarboxylate transporter
MGIPVLSGLVAALGFLLWILSTVSGHISARTAWTLWCLFAAAAVIYHVRSNRR